MRLCPFRGCGDTVPFSRFCCPAHWQRLPPAVRSAAGEQYFAFVAKTIDAPALSARRRDLVAEVAATVPGFAEETRSFGEMTAHGTLPGATTCPACGRGVLVVPLADAPGHDVALDTTDEVDGRYLVVGGVAVPRVGGRRGRAHARLRPHAAVCGAARARTG